MKITTRLRRALQSGSSLLMTLIIITATLLILAATLSRTVTTSKLNDRSNLYLVANAAAEAATEKAVSRMMVDFANGGLTLLTNNLAMYQTNLPNSSESSWWGNFTFSDGQGNNGSTYVAQTTTNTNPPYVALQYQYPGLNAFAANYRVVSNVKPIFGNNYGFSSAVQQDVQMAEIPVFQFGIFYNGTLEFSDSAALNVSGRVQCNTNIFVGSPSQLVFSNFVTCSGIITNPPMAGQLQSTWLALATSPSYQGVPSPGWGTGEPVLTLPIGTNGSAASVIQVLYPPAAGESTTNPISPQRYYNKAYLDLTISNSAVWLTVKNAMYDGGITFLTTNWVEWTTNNWTNLSINAANSVTWFGSNAATAGSWYGITNWLTLFAPGNLWPNGITNFGTANWATNYNALPVPGTNFNTNFAMYDSRQLATNRIVQIDVGKLGYWVATNQICTNKWISGNPFNGVLYVADWRTNTAAYSGWMDAVRLTNGATIYTNVTISAVTYTAMPSGLTVATPNPLYVCSDYNCPTADLSVEDVANTAPASFACDAITVLSTNWSDVKSFQGYGCANRNNAANTTVNAAIITGNVPSTGQSATTFSGGVQNLTRFLETWTGRTMTLNSSIICMYASAFATNQFIQPTGSTSTDYYEPPTWQYFFNTNYLTATGLPPGTPQVDRMIRATWCNPPPNTVTYSPYTNPVPYVPY
jgi:hypothetical protein